VAGASLLVLAVLAAAANFGVIQHLVTPGDPARTARGILTSAGLFRLAIAALGLVVVLDIVVARALLRFFEPVHHGVATLAAWLRVGYAAIFAAAISRLPAVLPLLSTTRHITAASTGQRQAEALMKIQDFQHIWQISLILFGLHLVLIGYLACKSGYFPGFSARCSSSPAAGTSSTASAGCSRITPSMSPTSRSSARPCSCSGSWRRGETSRSRPRTTRHPRHRPLSLYGMARSRNRSRASMPGRAARVECRAVYLDAISRVVEPEP
jgi:hypothetical protein